MDKKEFKKFLDEIGFTKETGLLVKAVKTNKEEISFLESRVAKLEGQNK